MFLRSVARPLALASLLAASLAFSGCGAGSLNQIPSGSVAMLSGIAHGGPNPVVGAVVQYYATSSAGYGAAGTLLGTATTGTDGSFNFVAPAACPGGQQAYVTAQGGNPGNGANPNYLLLAALGPCSSISPSTTIWIDEVTTVAAAETLRPFLTITSANGLNVVNIGAPANNNAAAGTCTVSGTTTTGCVAAGLTHAFANALNLANSVSIGAALPDGQAYAVAPSNPSSAVPQALINSLANSIEACVNSNGGVTGDGTPCGTLFAATTPPPTGSVAPTNTLQAMLDVAQYPALTNANVTALFNVVPPTTYYRPTLATQPTDYAVAISYTGVTVPGTVGNVVVTAAGSGYTAAPTVTLTGGGTPTTAATATASLSVVSLAFTPNTTTTCTAPVITFTLGGATTQATATAAVTNGVITSVTLVNPGVGYTSVPTVKVTGPTGCATGATVTPTLGVGAVAVTNPGTGYSAAPTVTITPSNGVGTGATATANYATTPFGFPYVEILDANDDLYLGSQNSQTTTGGYSFYPSITSNGSTLHSTPANTTYTAPRGLGIDTLGNLWATENGSLAVVELNPTTGAILNTSATAVQPFGLAIDRQNNVWYSGNQLFELPVNCANPCTAVAFTTKSTFMYPPRAIAIDQNQNIWTSESNSAGGTGGGGVYPNTGTAAAPAYGVASGSTQLTFTGNNTIGIAIDASGNAWSPSASGIYQLQPSGSPITAITSASGTTAGFPAKVGATPNYDVVDGAGTIWVANGGAQNIVQVVPTVANGTATGTTAYAYLPCYLLNGETACEAAPIATPQRVEADSTGAIWVTSLANGRIFQLLGPGSPTWPQLSLGAPGVMPQ